MNAHVVSDRRSGRILYGFALITIAALSGCNLPNRSPEPTQTPGAYATLEQSLRGSGNKPGIDPAKGDLTKGKCPLPGVTDYYNLCFGHQLNFVMSDGNGYSLTPYAGVNCVLLSLTDSEVGVVGGGDGMHSSVGFKIDGEWNFAGAKCTLSGQTSLNVSVYGNGDPPCRDKDHLFLLVYESWSPAPIHAECKPVRTSGDFHSTPVDVTVPLLEDRGQDLEFWPVTTALRQEATLGAFSGMFLYEVKPAAGIPSEVEQ